ncbi:MAG: hypothetical protein KKG21_05300 [Candidatus Omnitrophica bacterium]|nr:hypothetical protein [Candidatus Omnitrophota bacterium]
MLKGFVIGFICFNAFFILHIFIFHNWKMKFRFRALVRIFYSLLPLYMLLYISIPGDALLLLPADPAITPGVVIGLSKIFNFSLGIFIYLLLFFGYCQFYFIIDRSISVRIMIRLEKSKDKRLTLEQIKKAYKPDYIFLRRLRHMRDNKYIIEESGFYRNLHKGRITARLFRFLKGYLNLGVGG